VRRPGRDPIRPKTAGWLFSWLLLVVLACGYALPAMHFATVSHEICAVHGALEHVHAASEAARTDSSKDTVVSVTAAPSDEHECCGVLGISPPSVLVSEGALDARVTLELPANALREAPGNANLSVLSYAPKLAPPV